MTPASGQLRAPIAKSAIVKDLTVISGSRCCRCAMSASLHAAFTTTKMWSPRFANIKSSAPALVIVKEPYVDDQRQIRRSWDQMAQRTRSRFQSGLQDHLTHMADINPAWIACRCSFITPAAYCTGMSYPANAPSLRPVRGRS